MGDKTIPDLAEPRLESFYPRFVAGIDLPHQDVVDSYNPAWISNTPDSQIHGANIGPTWVLSAPDGAHVGPMNLAIGDHA